MWQRTKHASKAGIDKLWTWSDKLGGPVNRLSNRFGSEAFWPTTLDKESDKAARILRSFCKDGFYEEEHQQEHQPPTSPDGPRQRQRVLKKIPQEVIRNAIGLAIFTTMRSGLWVSGAGGSGVLVGRNEDGAWSPPSGIMLHTAGLGFLVGVDIYDCVVVINSREALAAFSSVRCTLGGEISAVAGPVGVGGAVESEVHRRRAPVFTYMKSRGFYAGVQIDGTVVIERTDENERFYGERIAVADILAGSVRHAPIETRPLMETIRAAQGDADVNEGLLPSEPPPGDCEIEMDDHLFGIPDKNDQDPYGVLALEKQGMHIVEAGTGRQPTSEAFEFNPSPQSPIFSTFSRAADRNSHRDSRTISRRSSWRTSTLSTMTDRATQTVDTGVQADLDVPSAAGRRASESETRSPMEDIPENVVVGSSRAAQQSSPRRSSSSTGSSMNGFDGQSGQEDSSASVEQDAVDESELLPGGSRPAPEAEMPSHASIDSMRDSVRETTSLGVNTQASDSVRFSTYDFENAAVEEPVVHQLRQTATQQAVRARLVTVKKPSAPKLPPRNPIRNRRGPLIISAESRNEATSRDSMSPRSPPSSSEQPSVSTIDSASTISSRDSFSSDDGADAMRKRIGMMRTTDSDQPEGKLGKDTRGGASSDISDEFHSVPATPDQRPRSPIADGL